jgi:dTDP-4-amino-4,6-dideoxygalactose transaminase
MINRIDLAIFGAEPAFAEKLYVGRPNLGDTERFIGRVREIFGRRWLTNNGPYVQEFEQRLAEFLGVKHCIAMCNATVALEISIRALGLTGEVIVPSFTFIATAHALQWQEITPVFCDINPRTHTLDPRAVEESITSRTSGIVGVHLWGRACDIGALTEIAERRNLKLLFDAAHAFACTHGGRMIGNFGNAEVFSFHATKFFNTFEGGAVATNDDDLATKIRLMKNFGFADYDQVIYIGTNGKMNEVSAAMGLSSLESLPEFIQINHRNYERYRKELIELPGVVLYSYDDTEKCNYQYVVLEIDEERAGLSRDQLMQVLHAENILARRYFYPGCHRMEPYKTLYPNADLLLPQTELVAARVMTLPTGQSINPEMVIVICDIIRAAFRNASEIRKLLANNPTG